VTGRFDLASGTVLTITLPDLKDGVVGLATVTPRFDTTPPVVTCLAPTAECTSPAGAVVGTLVEGAVDDCDVPSVACSPPEGYLFRLGRTPFGCTASDSSGNTGSCTSSVTVVDTVPPAIASVVAAPGRPLRERGYVPVAVTATATDACDASPTCAVTSVTGSLPDRDHGHRRDRDRDRDPDWILSDPGPKPSPARLEVLLRPEHRETYSIQVVCSDASGNRSTGSVTVALPDRDGEERHAAAGR
jgi:hypothetical protein